MLKNRQFLLLPLLALVLAACSGRNGLAAGICDSATFIDHVSLDVPVEEGSRLMPGTHFTKTWRVTNAGDCTWDTEYALELTSGEAMNPSDKLSLAESVAPGETIDFSIRMTAPQEPGQYVAEWMLRNAQREPFGVGADGQQPLLVDINVADVPPGVVYDFTQIVCFAEWHSGLADFLPCESTANEEDMRIGYVTVNQAPALEHSSSGNPPVIEMKGNNQSGGWITGIFPAITIQPGDEFSATVGCFDSMQDCSVTFSVGYELSDGTTGSLGAWEEVYDTVATDILVDLSELAGKEASIILRVEENGGRSLEAVGFWMDARIQR
ncbi:MAG: NBR1-Ig-like domain-containing protein [Chloroflexi bacterium]|nr:NBR1-Ig-like domain-containing protein [Chloroflexota bacterium]